MDGDERALIRRYRAARRDPALAVLEGFHALKHALRFGAEVEEVLAADAGELEELASQLAPDLRGSLAGRATPVSRELLAELVPPGTDRLAGTELGAVALAAALSLETDLPFVIVRKATKGYGTANLIEGQLHRGDRVVLVEDVVTSGAQAIRAAEAVVAAGGQVVAIVAVIDREQGGPAAIEAAGFKVTSLFSRTSLGL